MGQHVGVKQYNYNKLAVIDYGKAFNAVTFNLCLFLKSTFFINNPGFKRQIHQRQSPC